MPRMVGVHCTRCTSPHSVRADGCTSCYILPPRAHAPRFQVRVNMTKIVKQQRDTRDGNLLPWDRVAYFTVNSAEVGALACAGTGTCTTLCMAVSSQCHGRCVWVR